MSQQPHGYTDMSDLIQSTELYECFNSNSVEVDFFIDYLMSREIRPQKVYREVCTARAMIFPTARMNEPIFFF